MEKYTFSHLGEEDVQGFLDLMRQVFDESVARMVYKFIHHHPEISQEEFFLFKSEGKPVAGLVLIPQVWSLDGVKIRVAEMGCVATQEAHRRRGLQSKLVERYHKRLQRDNYDLSVIEGIPFFYRQFGYQYALPLDEKTLIDVDDLPNCNKEYKIRPLKIEEISEAKRLLEELNQNYLVTSVRSKDQWLVQERYFPQEQKGSRTYVLEYNGKIDGYFRLYAREHEICLTEASYIDIKKAESLLTFIRKRAKREGLERLSSSVSYSHPVSEILTSLGGFKRNSYAWQVRVMDHKRIFEKMRPVFERRLNASHYKRLTEKLHFNFYRFTVKVDVIGGRIDEVTHISHGEGDEIRINPYVFPQLLFGYKSLDELAEYYPDVKIDRGRWEIVSRMFPRGQSCISTCY
ncbi:MAG: GNAT family N-acetyltransferase [Candidatus Bathyarchaeia archaeon]